MMSALLFLALVSPGDTIGNRPCRIVIDSIGGLYRQTVAGADTNRFAGGGVLTHCEGTGSTLSSDSIAFYGGDGRVDMLGNVHIRDTTLALDARTAAYYLRDERLEAHNNVVAVNKHTGSVLRGPNLTYYRAVTGVRDTVEMRAAGRPVIEYRSAGDSAGAEPYVIVADRVRFKGDDQMWGGGTVTIDRSDFAARGDSVHLDERAGFGLLVGHPSLEGKGTEQYKLVGTRIELALTGRDIRLVKALGQGRATGSDWHLTADTIHLGLDQRKLQRAFAWGDSSRPYAVSTLNTIRSDSLALDVPDQVLTEARAFGKAYATSKRDSASTPAEIDWIAGDTIVANFVKEADTAGAPTRTRIQRLRANGSARALTHHYAANDSTPPAINYSRGLRISVALKQAKVDRVIVSGRADGVQLDPRPVRPAAPPDTVKPAVHP